MNFQERINEFIWKEYNCQQINFTRFSQAHSRIITIRSSRKKRIVESTGLLTFLCLIFARSFLKRSLLIMLNRSNIFIIFTISSWYTLNSVNVVMLVVSFITWKIFNEEKFYYNVFLKRLRLMLQKYNQKMISLIPWFNDPFKNFKIIFTWSWQHYLMWVTFTLLCNVLLKTLWFLYETFFQKFFEIIGRLLLKIKCMSPIVADLVMWDLEEYVLNSLNIRSTLYYRYIDDIILAAPKEEIHTILNKFNNYHYKLKFTLETKIDHRLSFLDITLIIKNSRIWKSRKEKY